jgi:hypothetical protein
MKREECNKLTVIKLRQMCRDKKISGHSKKGTRKAGLVDLCCASNEEVTSSDERCYIPEFIFEEGMQGIPVKVKEPLPVIPDPPSIPASYKQKQFSATRTEKNSFLRNAGYKWRKEEIYVDGGMASQYYELENYDGDFTSVWALTKPDGSIFCYGYEPSCDVKYEKLLVEKGFYGDEAITYENQIGEFAAAKKERAREMNNRIGEVRNYFSSNYREKDYHRPDKMDAFPPECLHPIGKGFNIYGGGEVFVATNKGQWDIENNGMDGDNWSRNNYPTGGAGAIATRFPPDERIKDFILSLPVKKKHK